MVIEFCGDLQSRVVDHECKLLSVIWLLATEESYRSVADRFGMTKGSLHFTAMQVVEVISPELVSDIFFSMVIDFKNRLSCLCKKEWMVFKFYLYVGFEI
jgi:hypothetical protein